MNKDVMICGVGGQGTVLASKIIAAAAAKEGHRVHSAETIGMAQRGGSVVSHIRIGEDAFSPMIPYGGADILLGFEPAEAVRNLKYLSRDGMVIVNSVPTYPVTESLKGTGYDSAAMCDHIRSKCRSIFVDADEMFKLFGTGKCFNIIMLGIAAGTGKLDIAGDTIKDTIRSLVPERFAELNISAFTKGLEIGTQS